MKNIQIYNAKKYSTSAYTKVEENIYKGKNPYRARHRIFKRIGLANIGKGKNSRYKGADWEQEELYVTSLTFEQEPELGEGKTPNDISQYPLEGILDMFHVYVTDFYDRLNANSETTCYQEFGSAYLEDIRELLSIVGKHVYEKETPPEWEELMDEEELEEEDCTWYKTVVE